MIPRINRVPINGQSTKGKFSYGNVGPITDGFGSPSFSVTMSFDQARKSLAGFYSKYMLSTADGLYVNVTGGWGSSFLRTPPFYTGFSVRVEYNFSSFSRDTTHTFPFIDPARNYTGLGLDPFGNGLYVNEFNLQYPTEENYGFIVASPSHTSDSVVAFSGYDFTPYSQSKHAACRPRLSLIPAGPPVYGDTPPPALLWATPGTAQTLVLDGGPQFFNLRGIANETLPLLASVTTYYTDGSVAFMLDTFDDPGQNFTFDPVSTIHGAAYAVYEKDYGGGEFVRYTWNLLT